jgi:hypothetical protein
MKWTHQKPTRPGWYWYRATYSRAECVYVGGAWMERSGRKGGEPLSDDGLAKWAGPIDEPTEGEVREPCLACRRPSTGWVNGGWAGPFPSCGDAGCSAKLRRMLDILEQGSRPTS